MSISLVFVGALSQCQVTELETEQKEAVDGDQDEVCYLEHGAMVQIDHFDSKKKRVFCRFENAVNLK